jgi:putative ABC transport system substrate-binding protein
MKKKITVLTLCVLLYALCSSAEAQQAKKLSRLGYLALRASASSQDEVFKQGLHDLGWIEGQNIETEYRWAGDRADRLPVLAEELVRSNVDVIVAGATPVIQAAKHATTTIPIVMTVSADAVDAGLVKSLAHPGENVTGLSFLDTELSAKRLELLKETLPKIARVAILRHVTSATASLHAVESAARSLRLQLQIHEVQEPRDLDQAFGAMTHEGAEALNVLASPILNANRKTLIELAAKHRLPAIYQWKEFVEEGGLMSYAASITDMYHRAATYVDKILKGAKPADLPVEQPTTFELVINLKTANQLGLTLPPNVLARADRVIK